MGTVKSAGVVSDPKSVFLQFFSKIPGNSHYSVLNFVKYEKK